MAQLRSGQGTWARHILGSSSIKLSKISKQSPPIHFQMRQDINKSTAFKRSGVKGYKSKDMQKRQKGYF